MKHLLAMILTIQNANGKYKTVKPAEDISTGFTGHQETIWLSNSRTKFPGRAGRGSR